MALFRDNPSDAEKQRKLTPKEERKYRRMMVFGTWGLLSVALVLVGAILNMIFQEGNLQVWAFFYMLFGFMIYAMAFVAGFSKGRDHRPGIFEMLGAGGRR